MKVYEKIVIDISSGGVVEEVSHEYLGPVALCKGGGGGSSSGKSDFPAYMKTIHGDWLDRGGASTVAVGESVNELIHAAIAASPYSGETAFDPDADITVFLDDVDDFLTVVNAIDEDTDWATYSSAVVSQVDTNIIDETSLAAAADAHGDILDDRLTSQVLPRFQAGMRDINAVISTSFTLGQTILEAFNTREVADFDAKNRLTSYGQRNQLIAEGTKDVIQMLNLRLEYIKAATHQSVEGRRVKVVMKKEELTEQLDIDDKDYRWPLEIYQYGNNVMSSISGAAINPGKQPSTMQSVLGGTLSGAAAGSMIPGIGTVAGGIIGGIGGLLS
jgi:hypothetical protein